ncbi:hypothetical protein HGA88_04390 [Candidatus Roizmanbacteria bacterium]|nr:hypothetical protein [Candidatus Roizmanbacteria bacterium]
MEEKAVIGEEPKKDLEPYKALLVLDTQERSMKAREGYLKAYILSVLFPPIGIYYFGKYLFFANGTQEDVKAAFITLAITVVVLVLGIVSCNFLFSSVNKATNSNSNSFLKELTVPENQKELRQLMQ